MKITDRKVLITGAGSGIGRELALRFGAAGGALALVGRRAEALEDTAAEIRAGGGTAHVIPADLADRSAPDRIVVAAVEHLGGLDVLINNAGNVRAGELESLSQPDIEAMVDVDLLAPILLTRAALPHLRAAEEGLVLGIASGIALVALPYYSVYSAVTNRTDAAAVDDALRPRLAALRAAVSGHRSI